MLPEFHRRMVVEQPGLPAQDVEIWPDPVGHNVLDVYATRAIEGVHVIVSDPKMATQQGVWFNQVLPFSSSATSETFTTKTHVGHFDTKHMKWFNPNETPWL